MSEPYRVVIVGHDAATAASVRATLENGLSSNVVLASHNIAAEIVARAKPDVVITDTTGLDLIADFRRVQQAVPVIVMTAEASVDHAVRALRNGANEFLAALPTPVELVEHVTRLADDYRATPAPTLSMGRTQRVLAIGAHPDDVEVGVGGILAAHAAIGDQVTIMTLSKGRRDGGTKVAWEESAAAAAVIGATLIFEDFVEGSGPLLPIIKRVVADVDPTIVYVHSKHDRRQDHRLVHEATVAATEEISTVACYQGTTGTISFAPTRFVPVDQFMETKLAMLACYATTGERPGYLETDFVLSTGRFWSQYGQGVRCEPLEIIRESLLSPVARVLVDAA